MEHYRIKDYIIENERDDYFYQFYIYLMFEELKEKIRKKNTMERIHMIGSLQEKLNSYHLGEYRLSKYIITFIE